MRTGRDTLNEAHLQQSKRIANIFEACSTLKPLTADKEQPNLHLVYMHAAALTEGMRYRIYTRLIQELSLYVCFLCR